MDADELYRLPPEAFTAARDAAAKERRTSGNAAGAAELKALRRPSVAAWLVNRLAHDSPELLDSLLALGPELAEAQSCGDAAALRALGDSRRRLVESVTHSAAEAAGRSVTASVREEVAATLEAALADPGSARAVRSGRLVRSLSYAGFGAVDLAGAVAPAAAEPAPVPTDRRETEREHGERRRRVQAAEAAAQEAAGRLDDAVRACEQAERRRADAQQEEQALVHELARLQDELGRLREQHELSGRAVRSACDAAEQARRCVAEAQDASEVARRRLDELRRGG